MAFAEYGLRSTLRGRGSTTHIVGLLRVWPRGASDFASRTHPSPPCCCLPTDLSAVGRQVCDMAMAPPLETLRVRQWRGFVNPDHMYGSPSGRRKRPRHSPPLGLTRGGWSRKEPCLLLSSQLARLGVQVRQGDLRTWGGRKRPSSFSSCCRYF